MCLAQGPQRSDAGEARTRGPSVSSQALYTTEPLRSQWGGVCWCRPLAHWYIYFYKEITTATWWWLKVHMMPVILRRNLQPTCHRGQEWRVAAIPDTALGD